MNRRAMMAQAVAVAVAVAAAALLAAPAARAEPSVVMRISHQVPQAHHMSEVLDAFAADVAARSGGGIAVQIFGSEQLARAAENYPSVARGAFEAAMSVNFQWGNTIPEMSALTIPYFFSELEQIRRFPQSEAWSRSA